MDAASLSALTREGMGLVATVGAPMFLALLGVGLVVGVLQAATQVNDAALGFLPKLAAGALVAWLLGPWMVERLALFFAFAVHQAAGG